MESVYYVISWLCHRTCGHCYEDRFWPYHGDARERILSQAERDCPRIIANLPASMVYLDRTCGLTGKRGRIILAGGEVLLEPVRSRVLFPALSALHGKYAGGVNLVIQTTGDLLTPAVLDEILRHPVWMVSVSGLDALPIYYHHSF